MRYHFMGDMDMSEEKRKYYDSEAKRKWTKENTVFIGLKLNKNTDADILGYLKDKPNQTEIKRILKEYIANLKAEE